MQLYHEAKMVDARLYDAYNMGSTLPDTALQLMHIV